MIRKFQQVNMSNSKEFLMNYKTSDSGISSMTNT